MSSRDRAEDLAPVCAEGGPQEHSGVHRVAVTGQAQPLSEFLWGVDWLAALPVQVGSDFVAVKGSADEVGELLHNHFPQLVEHVPGAEAPSPAIARGKAQFFSLCDLIELRHEGQIVGFFVGAPEDWSTYYCRLLACLPNYQHKSKLRRFAREVLFERLRRVGVERVTADTLPTNFVMTRWLIDTGFCPTGHLLTERWGALNRYTKFLQPSRLDRFADRFGGSTGNPGS